MGYLATKAPQYHPLQEKKRNKGGNPAQEAKEDCPAVVIKIVHRQPSKKKRHQKHHHKQDQTTMGRFLDESKIF